MKPAAARRNEQSPIEFRYKSSCPCRRYTSTCPLAATRTLVPSPRELGISPTARAGQASGEAKPVSRVLLPRGPPARSAWRVGS